MNCKRFDDFAAVSVAYARSVRSFTAQPHFCRMKLARDRLAAILVGAG